MTESEIAFEAIKKEFGLAESAPAAIIALFRQVKSDLDEANDHLFSCVGQAVDVGGKWDSMCISTYAAAMQYLGKAGYLNIESDEGRRVIATEKPR